MSSSKQYNKGDNSSPVHFENLEERLLLTTLMEGQYFIYNNTEGDSVRVQLSSDQYHPEYDADAALNNPASVDLFSLWRPMRDPSDSGGEEPLTDEMFDDGEFRATYQLHHLVGLRFGEGVQAGVDIVGWTGDGSNEIWDVPPAETVNPDDPTSEQLSTFPYDWHNLYNTSILDVQEGEVSWLKYKAGTNNKLPIRGASTEIFALYIKNPRPDVSLTITTLDSSDLDSSDGLHFSDINTWDSSSPVLTFDYNSLLGGSEWGEKLTAPGDSGGVIVGSIPTFPIDWEASESGRYIQRKGLNFMAATDTSHLVITDPGGIGRGVIYPEEDNPTWYEPAENPIDPPIKMRNYEFDASSYIKAGINISEFARNGDLIDSSVLKEAQMGKIMVAGTVSMVNAPCSIDTLYMGFLWGNINIEQNLSNLVMRAGGGGLDNGQNNYDPFGYVLAPDSGSLIHIGGTLDNVIVSNFEDGGSSENVAFFSAIEVENSSGSVDPSENKFELEYKAANYSRQNEEFLDRLWSSGAMLDVDNDTYRTAQFLSSRTGDFTLNGELRNSRDSTGGDSTFENDVDWYALALMAGQTIKIEEPGYDSKGNWRSAFSNWDTAVHIYEPGYFYDLDVDNTSTDDHWLDSFGYKTEEDWGHSSRYDGLDRLGAMTFTAPTAGVYYLKVFNPRYEGGGQYRLKFTNATKAALGGVNITADYSSVMNVPYAVRFDEIGDIVYELFTDNLVRYNHGTFKAEDSNIATKNAGNIGGIIIYGESYWANINTFEGGDIVSFEANEVGSRYLKNDIGTYTSNTITSSGNIGRVASTESYLSARIEAGAIDSDGFRYNNNAHVQNIYVATDYIWDRSHYWYSNITTNSEVTATGSIGVIEVGGNFNGLGSEIDEPDSYNPNFRLEANNDGVGPGGHIDLIRVKGDFYRPRLYHGPGGDVGYIYVDGDIYTHKSIGTYGLVTETVVTDGSSLTLNDDSGGRLTIDSQTGNIVPTTYAFTYIAVDDIAGGVGGVIANLRVEGSGYLRMYVTGLVQISNLDLRNSTYNTQVLIEDSPGQVDIYYLDGTETSEDGGQEDSDLVNLKAFVNDTYGELIAGTLGNIITVNLRGDLGQLDAGHTGAWLFGPKSAPIVEEANITEEPQYGWFHSTMNGLNVYGSLFDINIGGALGDLRVQGIIGDIKVNWDYKHNRRDVTQGSNWDDWDGVNGLVWSGKRIEYIDVGDGLADDGGSDLARAGIMSTRTIGEVFISGNRFERIAPDSFGVDETIKNPMVFGEINGAILAGGDDILEILRLTRFVSSEGVIFDGLFSEMTYRYVDAIGKVTGEGSTLTAIVAATGLDSFQCFKYRDFQYTGIVREVNFYYAGAEIDGAEIYGAIVDEVTTSLGANGINNTAITGDITTNSQYFRADYSPRQLSYPVREVRAGGSGMTNTYITANGGDIFKVATNNTGNIIGCTFVSGNSMGKIMSGNIVLSDFHMPGAIGYVRVADDILASQFNVGAIWDFSVGGDIGFLDYDADSTREFFTNLANKLAASGAHTTFMLPYYSDDTKLFYEQFINNFTSTGNIKLILVEIGESVTKTTFNVAGEIYRINVDGDFDSQLTLQGSATAYLKTLTVGGNIAGLISSSGNIGAIISRNGNISADITTTTNGYEAGNVKLIETKNGYTGNLDIAGSLGKLISHSSLGYNPAVVELETAQVINIAGDLDYLLIKAADGTPSHLFTNINVGGNSKTVDIEGTLYGNLIINGNLNKVQVDVALGGNPGELVGSPIEGYKTNIFVFGDLKYLRFNPDADLIANITIGGSINRIYTNGGSIIGDITSLFGTISNVKVRSGDIKGNLQGESIGTVYVNNGNLFGNITATNGNIKLVKVKYGDIKGPSEFNDDPKIIAENGQIQRLMVTNGNIDAGRMIEAKNGIGKVYVKGGYLDGDIDSGRAIDLVDVKGELGGNINAETYINRIKVNGTIFNTFIRSGGMINSIDATNVFSTTISSAWDINKVKIKESMVSSKLLAGYDIGDDGIMGTSDDNQLNGGRVHQANIKSVYIGDTLNNSIIAAGIDPGDNDYLTLGDNTEADGTSNINKITVRGGFFGNNAVLADTYIDSKFAQKAGNAGVVVSSGVTNELPGAGIVFGTLGITSGKTLVVGDLTLTLTRGRASYDSDSGQLVLIETNSRSSLTIKYSGDDTYSKIININASEDSALSNLKIVGNITLGHVTIDGGVKVLRAGNVESGSTWLLPGGTLNSLIVQSLTGVNLTAGRVNKIETRQDYSSGSLTADSIKQLYINDGMLGADTAVMTTLGGIDVVRLRNGALNSENFDIRGTIRSMKINGDLAGDVNIINGDLYTLVTNSLSGDVKVNDGMTKNVTVKTGGFTGSYKTVGIKKFTVKQGDFSGSLDSYSNLDKLSVNQGLIGGTVKVDGDIKKVYAQNTYGALVAASGNILRSTVVREMKVSYILAGFDAFAKKPEAGKIISVNIGDNMTTSTIAAGIAPGLDGLVGTDDDSIRGTGYVHRVKVKNNISHQLGDGGTLNALKNKVKPDGNASVIPTFNNSYGVFAANNQPYVISQGRIFKQNGNAYVKDMTSQAGDLVITNMTMTNFSITATFNHSVDTSTVDMSTFSIELSPDGKFIDDTTVVVDSDLATITYDSQTNSVTLTLNDYTWHTIREAIIKVDEDGNPIYDDNGDPIQLIVGTPIYRLRIDGMAIRDIRDNNMNGNDFTHGWVHNGNVLFDVPNYQNWFGNAPTAAAMLLGYYDGMEQYADLFEGNADQQTPEINEAIASSGTTATGEKAEYTYDPVTGVWTITKRAKTGTGHISDYALYHDPLDPYALNTTWDLSDPEALTNEELLRQFGLTDFDGLHTDDCLADLMQTSQVYAGNDLGETAPGYEVDDEGNPVLDDDGNKIGFVDRGIEDYVDSKGYSAEAVVHDDLSDFTWDDLVSNIDAGKPMLFYIDTNGEYDRSVFYYDTLDNDGNPIPRLEYDQISLFYVELDEFGNRKRDGNGEPIPHDFTQDTRGDTWIVVVGYSEETKEYAYYTTDDADIRWTSFVDVDTDEYYYHYNERAGKIIHVGHVLSDRHRPKDWIGAVDQIITLELT